MSTAVVDKVKCVDSVPGSSRYCASVYFVFNRNDLGGTFLATVVEPYEEMGVTYDRIVKVNSISSSIGARLSDGSSVVGDMTFGTFNSSSTVSERVGRYILPFDQGHVDVGGPFGAVVVHEGDVFGVRLTLTNLGETLPESFSGAITVNIDFSLVGHSL